MGGDFRIFPFFFLFFEPGAEQQFNKTLRKAICDYFPRNCPSRAFVLGRPRGPFRQRAAASLALGRLFRRSAAYGHPSLDFVFVGIRAGFPNPSSLRKTRPRAIGQPALQLTQQGLSVRPVREVSRGSWGAWSKLETQLAVVACAPPWACGDGREAEPWPSDISLESLSHHGDDGRAG